MSSSSSKEKSFWRFKIEHLRNLAEHLLQGKCLFRLTEFWLLMILFNYMIITKDIPIASSMIQCLLFVAFFIMFIADHCKQIARYNKLLFRHVPSQGIVTAAVVVYFLYSQQATLLEASKSKVIKPLDMLLIYRNCVMVMSFSTMFIGLFYVLQIDITFVSMMMVFSCYFLRDHISDLGIIIPSVALCIYFLLFWFLNRSCPRSFTIGESSILCQGFVLLFLDYVFVFIEKAGLLSVLEGKNLERIMNKSQAYLFVSTLLVSTFLVSLLLSPVFYCLANNAKSEKDHIVYSIGFYLGGVLNVTAIFLPMAYITLRMNVLAFLIAQLNYMSVFLTIYWLMFLALSLLIVVWHTDYNNRTGIVPNIIVRKSFHFIGVFIFVPGIYFYPDWMKIASSVAVVLLIILEYVRIFDVHPFSNFLLKYMRSFVDDRDQGMIILTHIYLLLGFSVPVWIFPFNSTSSIYCLVPYAGVISLGFGDAFASIFGTLYGKINLPGSKKTIIGTMACIGSQLIASLLILVLYHKNVTLLEIIYLFLGIIFVSFIEAVTFQIDNLILPLISYGVFVLVAKYSQYQIHYF